MWRFLFFGVILLKRFISALLVTGLLLSLTLPALAAPEGPEVNSKSAVLLERDTGKVLYESNAHDPLPIASVTKVMSLLLLGEALNAGKITFEDVVTVSEHAASMGGSQIYLEPGEQMSLEDMFKAVVVSSANDAVVALGEHLSGSETAFVNAMNARARELGMKNTNFVNASGLDAEVHLSTAYDVALMSRALLVFYPEIKRFTTIWMDSVRGGDFQLANTNKLVRTYTGTTGLKTGFTDAAGSCLSATAERDGMELICCILGSPNSKERFAAAKSLLDYGFANYNVVDVYPDDVLLPIPVALGEVSEVQPILAGNNRIVLDKGKEQSLVRSLEMTDSLTAPVENFQQVGELVVTSDGAVILRIPVVAANPVSKVSFVDLYSRLLRSMFLAK